MNAGFLEKRRLALDVYLHMILGADVLRKFMGSMEIVESFLGSRWDKASGETNRWDRLTDGTRLQVRGKNCLASFGQHGNCRSLFSV